MDTYVDTHTHTRPSLWKKPCLHGDRGQKRGPGTAGLQHTSKRERRKRSEWVLECTDRTEGLGAVGDSVSKLGRGWEESERGSEKERGEGGGTHTP